MTRNKEIKVSFSTCLNMYLKIWKKIELNYSREYLSVARFLDTRWFFLSLCRNKQLENEMF